MGCVLIDEIETIGTLSDDIGVGELTKNAKNRERLFGVGCGRG